MPEERPPFAPAYRAGNLSSRACWPGVSSQQRATPPNRALTLIGSDFPSKPMLGGSGMVIWPDSTHFYPSKPP